MANNSPTIFCPRNEAWENSFENQLAKLREDHPHLVLTEVNIEQIKTFNSLSLSDSGLEKLTGIVLEKNQIYSCFPFFGTENDFKDAYSEGIIWKEQVELMS